MHWNTSSNFLSIICRFSYISNTHLLISSDLALELIMVWSSLFYYYFVKHHKIYNLVSYLIKFSFADGVPNACLQRIMGIVPYWFDYWATTASKNWSWGIEQRTRSTKSSFEESRSGSCALKFSAIWGDAPEKERHWFHMLLYCERISIYSH